MRKWQPPYFGNKHLETIIPALFRKFPEVQYVRETIGTPDNDFLDLDWLKQDAHSLVVVFHGLEGSSESQYMKGTASFLHSIGHDVLCVNFRGCGGSPNKALKSYHSGATEDLHFLLPHLRDKHNYQQLYAVGFSLGGNVLLKYLGESGENAAVDKAVAISVPCDLEAGAMHLSSGFNRIYLRRFLKRLKNKAREKQHRYPDAVDYEKVYAARNFLEFDGAYTAPVNGFGSAEEYWHKCSSTIFIPSIKTPFLLINALNDPFLPKECYPTQACNENPYATLLTPSYGGHVGFPYSGEEGNYYEHKLKYFFE